MTNYRTMRHRLSVDPRSLVVLLNDYRSANAALLSEVVAELQLDGLALRVVPVGDAVDLSQAVERVVAKGGAQAVLLHGLEDRRPEELEELLSATNFRRAALTGQGLPVVVLMTGATWQTLVRRAPDLLRWVDGPVDLSPRALELRNVDSPEPERQALPGPTRHRRSATDVAEARVHLIRLSDLDPSSMTDADREALEVRAVHWPSMPADGPTPRIVVSPQGSGRTTWLRELERELSRRGETVVRYDDEAPWPGEWHAGSAPWLLLDALDGRPDKQATAFFDHAIRAGRVVAVTSLAQGLAWSTRWSSSERPAHLELFGPGVLEPTSREWLRDVLARRVDRAGLEFDEVFDGRADLERLLDTAEGRVKRLLRMTRDALSKAAGLPVTRRDVERAIGVEQRKLRSNRSASEDRALSELGRHDFGLDPDVDPRWLTWIDAGLLVLERNGETGALMVRRDLLE